MATPAINAAARRAARLQAVQALYQIEQTGSTPEAIVAEFERHHWTEGEAAGSGEAEGAAPDAALFRDLVLGAARERERLDALIGPLLAEGWTMPRLPLVLAAALRAGAFELATYPEVPPRATINEYVEVAHEFLDGEEPGLVNALLDRLARGIRPDEMGAAPARARV
jgi:transcription antitermination protein NusB